MLIESRRNPELNPKISIYDNLKPYYDLDVKNDESKYFIHLTGDVRNDVSKYFIHLTGRITKYKDKDEDVKIIDQRSPFLPKIGINPRQSYNSTPFGIYAYPLKDSWTIYHIGTKRNLNGIFFPSQEENRKYVYVFKTKSSINLINVKTYTEEQLERDKKLLNKLYEYDYEKRYEEPAFNNFNKNHIELPYFKLKNITYNIAKKYSKNKIILTWSTIFIRLGYDGIYDPGLGLIDPSELCQCVFFKKEVIKDVKLFINKTYNETAKYKFKNLIFNGIKRNGILHFDDLDISDINIESLKELPWSNQPYSVSNIFDCSYNLLKDLEGGPIYADEYLCNNNQLETLKGAPDRVDIFNCSYNETLKTLEGAPKIAKKFNCYDCSIQSLQYISDNVTKLDCSDNKIASLKYLPKTTKDLNCSSNKLMNLKYSNDIMSIFVCSDNQLKSLKGAPKECDEFRCVDCGLNDLKGVPEKLNFIDFSRNDVRTLNDLVECREIRCLGNENLKLDFKPKNLKTIDGSIDQERIDDFLYNSELEK